MVPWAVLKIYGVGVLSFEIFGAVVWRHMIPDADKKNSPPPRPLPHTAGEK
jgi:hypothetical protein